MSTLQRGSESMRSIEYPDNKPKTAGNKFDGSRNLHMDTDTIPQDSIKLSSSHKHSCLLTPLSKSRKSIGTDSQSNQNKTDIKDNGRKGNIKKLMKEGSSVNQNRHSDLHNEIRDSKAAKHRTEKPSKGHSHAKPHYNVLKNNGIGIVHYKPVIEERKTRYAAEKISSTLHPQGKYSKIQKHSAYPKHTSSLKLSSQIPASPALKKKPKKKQNHRRDFYAGVHK